MIGTGFVHTIMDDHSRVAYAEIHTDETATTAFGVLQRAVACFADHGVTIERILSDNGSCYGSFAWRDTCPELGLTPKSARPYRLQTNGKIVRFHHTLTDSWATPGSTTQPTSASRHCPAGSTSTIITQPIPPSAATTTQPTDQRPWTSRLALHADPPH